MKDTDLVARIEEALTKNEVDELCILTSEIDLACESDAEVNELCRDVFHLALELGSEVGLQTLLSCPVISSHVDINEPTCRGMAPAVTAVHFDNVPMLSLLVDHGADPFCSPHPVSICAHPLSSPRPVSTVRLTSGRYTTGVRDSIFDTACRDGRHACVRYLLSRLIDQQSRDQEPIMDANTVNKLLYRAMMAAVEQNQADVVKILLDVGADANANFDNDIGTALHVCARYNSVDCVDVLFARGAVDMDAIATDRQQTPLMISAQYSHIDIARRLLANGAEVNKQTHECSSALVVACHYGHNECVDLLLAYGADAHLKNPWDYSALYMGTDTPEILQRLLLESVAEVNEKCGEREEVPLHLATVIGSIGAVQSLLDVGADINRQTIYYENSLWLAAWKGHEDVARVLIQNNIDLDVYSNGYQVYVWYYLPIELAIGLQLYKLMKMLLVAGCKLRNDKYYSFRSEQTLEGEVAMEDSTAEEESPSNGQVSLIAHPGSACNLAWVQLRPEVFDIIKYNQVEFSWLLSFLTTPISLKNSCRISLRRSLRGGSFRQKVGELPLPWVMKNYLLMEDLNDL